MHPDAGGVDAGNASPFAAAPPDRDPHPVREFGCWTRDLIGMAEWFRARGAAYAKGVDEDEHPWQGHHRRYPERRTERA
jgi:hypothetical protein